jgi:hypothetical protein
VARVSPPPREAFAAAARHAVERHAEWDSPHAFETLHWDGEKLTTMTYACIMPDVDPVKYPAYMTRLAREELDRHPDDPAYGYLLQVESFGMRVPGPGDTAAYRERYEDARRNRTFHLQPDAREVCTAWAADIHGRLWFAQKGRGDPPGQVTEAFYRADAARRPGGPAIGALLAVAEATGMRCHGLPGPRGRVN